MRVLPSFPRSLASVTPARSVAGDESQLLDRRLAAAAAATVADVITRWQVNYDGTGVGLREVAGRTKGDEFTVFTLRRVELVPGVGVSGTVRWSIYGRGVSASLRVSGPSGSSGELRLPWSLHIRLGHASLTGRVDVRTLRATMLAPCHRASVTESSRLSVMRL